MSRLKSSIDKSDSDKFKNIPTNFNNLKRKIDKLDVDKLLPVPVDSCKLSDLVKNDVTNYIDITNATFNAKINKVKKEILNITNLTTTTVFNVKTNEVKNKIPNITDLATTFAIVLLKIKHLMLVIYSKKLTITQKLVKLKIKLLLIMTNILLLKNLIS